MIDPSMMTDELHAAYADAQKAEDERDQLIKLIEFNGFEVMRGDFVLKNGTHSSFHLRPNDVRRLIIALTSAYVVDTSDSLDRLG
jgi:hypothetical protein